ncbi:MAG: hypothetical protein ACLFVI_06315 [Archaeoglobaceae archaeon]
MVEYYWQEAYTNPEYTLDDIVGYQIKIKCLYITFVLSEGRISPTMIHEGVDNDTNGVVLLIIYPDKTLWWQIGHYPVGEGFNPDKSGTYSFDKYMYLRLIRRSTSEGNELVMSVLDDNLNKLGEVSMAVTNLSGKPYPMTELNDDDSTWTGTYERGWIDEIEIYFKDGTSEIWPSSDGVSLEEHYQEESDDHITVSPDTSLDRMRFGIEVKG